MGSTGELLLNINNEDFGVLTQYTFLQSSLAKTAQDRTNYYMVEIDKAKKLIEDNKKLLLLNISVAEKYQITDYINTLQSQIDAYESNLDKLTKLTINDVLKTHSIFLNYTYKPFVSCGVEYMSSQFSNNIQFGNSLKISLPIYGDFITQPVISITLTGLEATDIVNKVKYCEFIGHKILKKVEFINEGIVKDYLTSEDYNIYFNCEVSNNQKKVWKDCVGQENPFKTYLNPDPLNNEFRESKYVYFGPQTPKQKHDTITMYIPLLFWFYDDTKALPNNVLSKDMSLFNIELDKFSNICACLDYNGTGGEFTIPTISNITLYTKHLFVTDEILDLFINKEVNTLIRLHQSAYTILDKPTGSISLNLFTLPIKALFITARPVVNEDGEDRLNTWVKNKFLTPQTLTFPVIYDDNGILQFGANNVKFYTEEDVLSSLTLSTKGINMFHDNNIKFFSNCTSLLSNVNNSDNFVIDFSNSLETNTGFLNPKNLPGLNLNYTSKLIDVDNQVKLYVHAYCINLASFKNGRIEYMM